MTEVGPSSYWPHLDKSMSRLNTFFLEATLWPTAINANVTLDKAESRHLLKVLRAAIGTQVRLFDGCGRHGLFRLIKTERNSATLTAEELFEPHIAPEGLWLALGWSKSSRRGFLLEKAVELGAAGIWFWQAEYSQGKLPDTIKSTWTERCIQAAKQCGATFIPELRVINGNLPLLLEECSSFDHTFLAWEKENTASLLGPNDLANGKSLVIIGPEGGLSEKEATAFTQQGALSKSLGSSILRWETAALHCLSLSFYARSQGSAP